MERKLGPCIVLEDKMEPGATEEREHFELVRKWKKSGNMGDLESAERREERPLMLGTRKEAPIREAFQGFGIHSDYINIKDKS